jgi:predicted transcriptional regulator
MSSKLDLYVIARIIKALKDNNHRNKTALATATGMSYDKFIRYLEWLTDKEFVELDSDGLVVLTKKGSKAYDELVQWILKHVGRLRFPRL